MATTISVIGLLLAAIIFVVAIWKGLDVFTSTILVSFIIILTSWMDWWTSLSSYAEGYVGFIQNNVFVLVIGDVLGGSKEKVLCCNRGLVKGKYMFGTIFTLRV